MSENIASRREKLDRFVFNQKQTNASLWLNKFITEQKVEKGKESSAKSKLVEDVSKIEVPDIYEHFFNEVWLKSFKKIEKKCIEITGRMIIGLGAESVLETSLTLHRTYGVPFIPGSALKGLAANYAHRFMGENWKKETKKSPIGKAHKLMFGSQESAGYVIFHDALYIPNSYKPNPKNPLRPDILTVHHQKYYEGKGNAPADWDSPVPIPLLSAQGQYLLAVSANSGDEKFDKKLMSLAIDILKFALKDEGIGAKTSSGYGRASVIDYLENQNTTSLTETKTNEDTQLPNPELQLSDEERQANRFEGIKQRLEEIGKYDKDEFKKIFKSVKKLPIEKQIESFDLMIEIASNDPAKPVFENAGWFLESKEVLKKR